MGSVLLRNQREITDEGKTKFKDHNTPVLTLVGEKDGLMRISRGAESFWHQSKNIDQSQKDMFPVVYLEGVAHSSFMDSTMLPSSVKNQDLAPELEEKTAHSNIGAAISAFIKGNEQNTNEL